MPQDPSTVIAAHSQFYRNNFRRLHTLAFVLITIAYLMLGFIIYEHLTRPTPQYFVTTSDGRLIEIKPLGIGG